MKYLLHYHLNVNRVDEYRFTNCNQDEIQEQVELLWIPNAEYCDVYQGPPVRRFERIVSTELKEKELPE